MAADLDRIDRQILGLLRADGRMSHAAIAKEVGLSGPAIHERVRKLEQKGVIASYAAIVDPEMVDRSHAAFVLVTISEGSEFADDDEIVEKICDEPDVLEFHRIAGQDCYLIKMRCATNKDLEQPAEAHPIDQGRGTHPHDDRCSPPELEKRPRPSPVPGVSEREASSCVTKLELRNHRNTMRSTRSLLR